jgi:hypothetical protein
MSVTETQVDLPDPPTGMAVVIAKHNYNPENGHYEPPLRAPPLNASVISGTLAAPANLVPVVAAGAIWWVYHIVLANTSGANETCVITEPGGQTYTVEVLANTTVIVTSTPDAPVFIARNATAAAVNITFGSDIITSVTATITYVTK